MGATGSFPVDLVLLGMVAAFLVLRLRGILGKRTGYERPPAPQPMPQAAPTAHGPVQDSRAETAAASRVAVVPEADSAIGRTLTAMRGIDPGFDPGAFLAGVDKAFRMIVAGFASGDRAALRPLLSDDTFLAFDQAIAAREAAGHTQIADLKSIERLSIETASLHGSVADIAVRIVSDQVGLTRDNAGAIVVGAEAVTELTDLWSFERDLRSPDPTWRLVAARSA